MYPAPLCEMEARREARSGDGSLGYGIDSDDGFTIFYPKVPTLEEVAGDSEARDIVIAEIPLIEKMLLIAELLNRRYQGKPPKRTRLSLEQRGMKLLKEHIALLGRISYSGGIEGTGESWANALHTSRKNFINQSKRSARLFGQEDVFLPSKPERKKYARSCDDYEEMETKSAISRGKAPLSSTRYDEVISECKTLLENEHIQKTLLVWQGIREIFTRNDSRWLKWATWWEECDRQQGAFATDPTDKQLKRRMKNEVKMKPITQESLWMAVSGILAIGYIARNNDKPDKPEYIKGWFDNWREADKRERGVYGRRVKNERTGETVRTHNGYFSHELDSYPETAGIFQNENGEWEAPGIEPPFPGLNLTKPFSHHNKGEMILLGPRPAPRLIAPINERREKNESEKMFFAFPYNRYKDACFPIRPFAFLG